MKHPEVQKINRLNVIEDIANHDILLHKDIFSWLLALIFILDKIATSKGKETDSSH